MNNGTQLHDHTWFLSDCTTPDRTFSIRSDKARSGSVISEAISIQVMDLLICRRLLSFLEANFTASALKKC